MRSQDPHNSFCGHWQQHAQNTTSDRSTARACLRFRDRELSIAFFQTMRIPLYECILTSDTNAANGKPTHRAPCMHVL